MRLRVKICLVFLISEPQYPYKRCAYKKTCMDHSTQHHVIWSFQSPLFLPLIYVRFFFVVHILDNGIKRPKDIENLKTIYLKLYLGGVLKGRNTEIGLFSRRNSEKLYIFWRISETGIVADTEILYFDRYLTDSLE